MDQNNRAKGSVLKNIIMGFGSGSKAVIVDLLPYTQMYRSDVVTQLYRADNPKNRNEDQYCQSKGEITEIARKSGSLIKHLKCK